MHQDNILTEEQILRLRYLIYKYVDPKNVEITDLYLVKINNKIFEECEGKCDG